MLLLVCVFFHIPYFHIQAYDQAQKEQQACERNCEIHDTLKAYENCLRRCYSYVDYNLVPTRFTGSTSNKKFSVQM
ncbi:hypothetical protein T01_15447 [Trichinella spiralis]|uniref:Uncharacterized protein n=1 Tax=Trichinella spiralis TaxID=6334 RepID=A0A0V1BBU7_TRISP|nr:hypothetical protein T01_15447 [Trichinella spiralis]